MVGRNIKWKLKFLFEKLRNKHLCKKYPWLLPKDWMDNIPSGYDYSYTTMTGLSKGWNKAFGLQLMKDIHKELVRCDFVNDFHILETKSKYGEMRIYVGGLPRECRVDEIINNYMYISRGCCETCGKPDVGTTKGGWVEPICEHCWNKRHDDRYTYEEYVYPPEKIKEAYTIHHYCQDGGFDEMRDVSGILRKVRKHWKHMHPWRALHERSY